MSNINLLPWRDWQQRRRKHRFMVVIVGVCALSIGAAYGTGEWVQHQLALQYHRNQQLNQVSLTYTTTRQEFERAQQQAQQLAWQRDFIEQELLNSQQALRLFHDLPHWLPSGVKVDSLLLTSELLEIKGQALSYQQLSLALQSIEAATWLRQPLMQAERPHRANPTHHQQFSLRLKVIPVAEHEHDTHSVSSNVMPLAQLSLAEPKTQRHRVTLLVEAP